MGANDNPGNTEPTVIEPSALPAGTGSSATAPTVLSSPGTLATKSGTTSFPTIAGAGGSGRQPPPDEGLSGSTLGDFVLETLLGRGGMGAVYKGRQVSLDRPVAVKILPPHLAHDEGFRGRFQIEAKSVAKLTSAHVVQVYGAGIDRGLHWFAMEYVEGHDLARLVREKGKLGHRESLDFVLQAARGLAAAGDLGIVHRDIKPSNLMVTPKGVLKLMDFGLAKVSGSGDRLTMTGTVMGTVSYFSPEQGRGESCDHRTDLYALGVVFYELLTGRLPFQGEDPTSIIYQHIHVAPKAPREVDPAIPEDYQAVCLKCMQKRAEDRYQDAHALVRDLEHLLKGEAPQIDAAELIRLRDGSTLSVPPKRPRQPMLIVAAAGAVVLGVLALGVAVTSGRSASPVPERPLATGSATAASGVVASDDPVAGEIQDLLDHRRFADARARLARSRAERPGDVGLASLAQSIDAAEGAGGLAMAREALDDGDVDGAAARAASVRPLLPGSQELASLEQDITRRQEAAGDALNRAEVALARGDLAAVESALIEAEKANPRHRQLGAARNQLVAAKAERERKQKATAEAVARGEQALAANDLPAARTAFAEAKAITPDDPAMQAGVQRVEAAERRRATLAQEIDVAVAAGDLATAETRLTDLRPLAAGTDLGRVAEQNVAALRARKDDERKAAEAQERSQVAIAARLQARLDDLDEPLASLEKDIADFATQYPGRGELPALRKRLGDRQARRIVESRLAMLDAAVRSGDANAIAGIVRDRDYALRLGKLADYRSLRFDTRLATFTRHGEDKASGTLAIRHSLETFPERTLTYAGELELVDGAWVVVRVTENK